MQFGPKLIGEMLVRMEEEPEAAGAGSFSAQEALNPGFYSNYFAIQEWDYLTNALRRDSVDHGLGICTRCGTLRRAIFDEVGGFDEHLASAQDWDLWVRLIERWGSGLRLKEALYSMHIDHEMPRISISAKKVQGMRDAFDKHSRKMSKAQRKLFGLKIRKAQSKPYMIGALMALSMPGILSYYLRRVTKRW